MATKAFKAAKKEVQQDERGSIVQTELNMAEDLETCGPAEGSRHISEEHFKS